MSFRNKDIVDLLMRINNLKSMLRRPLGADGDPCPVLFRRTALIAPEPGARYLYTALHAFV